MAVKKFIADLHLHSKYSRATSKEMNLENLWKWAQLKGIQILGTGDFTHPRWFNELHDKLEPAEKGLFKLKAKFAKTKLSEIPQSCQAEVRFMLSAEISSIFTQNGRGRKVHNLIYAPDFISAGKINAELIKRNCNLESDGRPIIGLSAKDLLKYTLSTNENNVFVPAHIWTPHFAVLGASSGFNSLEECFEELTPEIFAIETGLSSDPPMNWQIASLDKIALISNSDAHSPMKLGREANIFKTEFSYQAIWQAVRQASLANTKKSKGLISTIEFFPEEGKYHFDGHRDCQQRITPEETLRLNGLCPVCRKPVTVGVLHRVMKLANRPYDQEIKNRVPFISSIPLIEIIAECFDCGTSSKKVQNEYFSLLKILGNEFKILLEIPIADLKKNTKPIIAEGIQRIRQGNVLIQAGYDGKYGTIHIFSEKEREEFFSPPKLF